MQPVVRRGDLAAALLVVLVPIVVGLPQLLGVFQADPLFTSADIGLHAHRGIVAGQPFIDPNAGFQTQALGYRSALQWLAGKVPWWNHYTGIGLPLAPEYQPGSFFPLTFLTLLPLGMVYMHVLLQCVAGLGAFLALRSIGVTRRAAAAGGMLFALNGTCAWLPYGPGAVAPWLPWFVYGIERARSAAEAGSRGGWRLLALAMAMSLLAGFPETAYINGLFCLLWACVRGLTLTRPRRVPFGARIAAGGTIGILLAAPQWASFLAYLGDADIANHVDMAYSSLPRLSAIASLVAPYVFGPIFAYHGAWPFLAEVWGGIGGYVTIALVATAVCGFWARRDALAWALVAWILLALGKTFLVEPAVTLWNWVPFIKMAAFARYAPPSWEFALVVLAARALDAADTTRVRNGRILAAVIALAAWGCAAFALSGHWKELAASRGLANSAIASLAWALVTVVGVLAWLGAERDDRRRTLLAALLVFDAALMAFVPSLSAPRATEVNRAPLEFLRANLGLQRFFTLGPIAPNYGAYFGLASINHNYLPVPDRWVRGIQARFDRTHDDPVVFDGRRPSATIAARENVEGLESLAVRYVIAPAGADPYAGRGDVKAVYRDAALTIFELPSPAPYWESSPSCRLTPHGRDAVTADCARPSTLVRRELFLPGWTAVAGDTQTPVRAHEELFQAVNVPAGRSVVEFHYSPAHARLAWLLMGAALLVLLASAGMDSVHRRRARALRAP